MSTRAKLALLAASLALGCTRGEPPGNQPRAAESAILVSGPPSAPGAVSERLPAEERTWVWENTPIGKMQVVVLLPERSADERFPVLVTMHGRGEALKGPERGARGWVDDYALGRAITRLHAPPLTALDFENHVAESRLTAINRLLAREPYRGLIVACPYTPDMLAGKEPFSKAPRLATFLVDTLLPRLRAETPALASAAATGIDGVSLGGRAAITAGLLRPEAFGAVGALQAAFDVDDSLEIAARARAARARNPELKLRLLSSDGDYYLRATQAIDRALEQQGVAHELLIVRGPHDYDFNRGPGAIEMLVYHDRVLRGQVAP